MYLWTVMKSAGRRGGCSKWPGQPRQSPSDRSWSLCVAQRACPKNCRICRTVASVPTPGRRRLCPMKNRGEFCYGCRSKLPPFSLHNLLNYSSSIFINQFALLTKLPLLFFTFSYFSLYIFNETFP